MTETTDTMDTEMMSGYYCNIFKGEWSWEKEDRNTNIRALCFLSILNGLSIATFVDSIITVEHSGMFIGFIGTALFTMITHTGLLEFCERKK